MTSQTIQGWHPNPQLMQPQQQAPPPQGWTDSWPPGGNVVFPPGYPGPPPAPGGSAAHPRWNAGYWQYNPLANVQNPQQPWAPGVGWFPPNFNPYKRVPKPPSPSYWNTKLTDNGLGLEGMVKRKDPSEYKGEEPHTPWIWNPPSLLESGDRATPTRDFNLRRSGSEDNSLRNTSTHMRDYGQSSRGSSQEGSSAQAHNQTPERRSSSRTNYIYTPQVPNGPARHSSDPSEIRSSQQSGGGFAGPSTSSQRSIGQGDSWPSRSRSQPSVANEVPPYPAPTPTVGNHSASAQQTVFTQEPETFTSRGELHPTFSSSIIRTPTHYERRRSTDELHSGHYSRSPSSTGHSSTPSHGPPAHDSVTRQSSLPNASSSTRDMYTTFTEDMANSLNASTSSRTWSTGPAGTLSRSRTEPVIANLTTIHESSSSLSSGEMFLAPLRDPASSSSTESSPDPSPRRRDRRTSPYASGAHSPEPSPLYRDHRPSPYAPSRHANPNPNPNPHPQSHSQSHYHPQSASPSPSPSPHARVRDPYATVQGNNTNSAASGHRRDNPLPPPPVERANLEASRPPVQERSPPRYAHKVRMGFWNRRGDHLTPNSCVVYAPHDRVYPEELRDYPDEREGYRDQFGTVVAWRAERPELPASLPYHGRAPTQPYESFVVYAYLQ
ncbi:hypothetical protein J3R82DRAFT_6744 [Butyriboletus roseoflavus]|nr:hypothetical protein J3R82DRAFT_6744 [Butyriboletus roseoflavus]